MQEVRHHRRLEGPVIVDYRFLDDAGMRGNAPAANISEGGVCFHVARLVPLHTAVELQLHIGRVGANAVTVRGQVIWMRQGSEPSPTPYEIGIAFDQPSTQPVQYFLRRLYVYWRQLMRPPRE